MEKLRAKGSEAVLNLDYEDARRTATEMTRLFPADPIGPQMLAWTLWLETLNKARLRQPAIYSSQSFEPNSEDKPDPQVTQEFRDLIRQATQLARARLQKSPRDPQALYSLGAVDVLRAGYELTVEGRANVRVLTLTNTYPPHYYGGYELTCHDVMRRFTAAGPTLAGPAGHVQWLSGRLEPKRCLLRVTVVVFTSI